MPDTATETERAIRNQVVIRFHHDLDRRYRRETLESNDEIRKGGLLDGIESDDIEAVRNFVKQVLYPTVEDRDERDTSLATMERMFSNPGTVLTMLPSLPRLTLRHGAQMPKALAAGAKVVNTYELAGAIEDELVEHVLKDTESGEDIDESAPLDSDRFRSAYRRISRDRTRRLLKRGREIVELGLDRKLEHAVVDLLEALRDTVDDEARLQAIDYIVSLVSHVTDLADRFATEELERIIRIVTVSEENYDERLRSRSE